MPTRYDVIHNMSKDELAIFLAELKSKWCKLEGKEVMEAIKARKWLSQEAENASKQ